MTLGKFSSNDNGDKSKLTKFSIRCRLPQTPKTPSTTAAHYFDDVFTKYKIRKPSFRRSSTSRSIGGRSDWVDVENPEGKDDKAVADEEDERSARPFKRVNSVGYFDEEALEKKRQIDEQVATYVSGQLEKMKSGESAGDGVGDELEAQLDGA